MFAPKAAKFLDLAQILKINTFLVVALLHAACTPFATPCPPAPPLPWYDWGVFGGKFRIQIVIWEENLFKNIPYNYYRVSAF